MQKPVITKLSQEVINQIAAGEVVERPSSVVKELVDNSIDAQASKIHIKIKNGGIDSIEISDNGIGIPKENIASVFDSHTTSKIKDIEDLNTLLSMGFRGEALSTITSVSRVHLASKYEGDDIANEIYFDEKGKSSVKKTAKEQGTTVRVENIFYNIPARKKYLKTAQTEYRKIYELLTNYFLIYPNIHFILEKDGKVIEDLPEILNNVAGEISLERVKGILGDSSNFLKLNYNGSGLQISGYIAHPSSHSTRQSRSYIFVNNRPISDRGIVRAVYEGYSRYLPFGQKVDFVVSLNINPELVDVNVHPRKEEVRFENPFRIYSAVEEAVRHTLEKELSFKNTSTDFSSLRNGFKKESTGIKEYKPINIYTSNKSTSVKDTLLFSKELLKDSPPLEQEEFPWDEDRDVSNIFQIFNKYIVVEFRDDNLWIVDQHAAAERVTFEKLLKGKTSMDIQNYLVPIEIELRKDETIFLDEHTEFFKDLGILYEIKDGTILLMSSPVEFSHADFKKVFEEIFALEENISQLEKNFKKLRDDVLATISCHNSIRSGQALDKKTMLDLFDKLSKCDNPYSCPHGRPAVWKLTLSQIDSNFERTY